MIINVHAGHAPDGKNGSGAVGIVKESTVARQIKDAVIAKLRALGHTVYDCTCSSGGTATAVLKDICSKANAHNVDLDISIHLNCFNGTAKGTEVLVYKLGGKAEQYAKNIVNSICELGYTNRGIKVRNDLYYLKNTNNTSLLIEAFFCDNQEDVNRFNLEQMANAIVKGITGQVANTVTPTPTPQPTPSKPKNYLSKGDKGSDVKDMQTKLIACGYSCGKSGADGDFGSGTKTAVENFQRDHGLTIDGKFGTKSKAKLDSVYANKTAKPAGNIIALGQQHSINFTGHSITTDGIKGSNTKKNMIRCIQHAINLDYGLNLVVDGIWGAKSIAAAGSHYVKYGETQYLVTALEIIMMCNGKDPKGVECPGKYGSGLKAVAGEKVTVKQMKNFI